jgi:uncharacterized membrane protein
MGDPLTILIMILGMLVNVATSVAMKAAGRFVAFIIVFLGIAVIYVGTEYVKQGWRSMNMAWFIAGLYFVSGWFLLFGVIEQRTRAKRESVTPVDNNPS